MIVETIGQVLAWCLFASMIGFSLLFALVAYAAMRNE